MAPHQRKVNYNQIAHSYHQRYQINPLDNVARALQGLTPRCNAQRILEAGCGTGRWLETLSSLVTQAVGLDLSLGMLEQARQQARSRYLVCGQAAQLPFQPQSFDLVFCVNALHHFDDPAGFISAAGACLKPGGCLAIVGQVPQDRLNRWFVYDYFPETYQTDLERFPPWEAVQGWMESAGFSDLQLAVVEKIHDPKVGAEVLNDPFLEKTAISQLALLSERAYQQGIERIRKALEQATDEASPLVFKVDLRLDMLSGIKQTAV